jgi:hypothetical protein
VAYEKALEKFEYEKRVRNVPFGPWKGVVLIVPDSAGEKEASQRYASETGLEDLPKGTSCFCFSFSVGSSCGDKLIRTRRSASLRIMKENMWRRSARNPKRVCQ